MQRPSSNLAEARKGNHSGLPEGPKSVPPSKPSRQGRIEWASLDPPKDLGIERLLEISPAESRGLIRKAYELADRLHEGQKRISGEAYIHHPLAVAWFLAELNLDGPSIAAGLLHDVLEDTEITREELAEQFPGPTSDIVQGVTKITKMSFMTTREAQVENLRLMILAMAQDIRVVIVKLCDRLHNMQTLRHLPAEKRLAVAQETLDIYAPLANRLGIQRIKIEMEDMAMRWLHPEAYHTLAKKVARRKEEREQLVKESIAELQRYLTEQGKQAEITGRPKHFYSIYRKMKDQGLTFDQIYDLNAIRIICEEEAQCYEVLGLVHALWPPLPGRFKDYIGMPKKNLYRSLHTTVIGHDGAITEIQIRTRAMHEVAEYGIAAHWMYKEKGSEIQKDERLNWLRQLTEWITDVNEPSGLLEALKQDVFADRVLCFTPRGKVIELPASATPIDFAYAIHTEVGEQCIGARINNRMVNLRTKLQNGDVVEILTSPNGHPSRDWLDYVVTGRARQKIKHWLKGRNIDEWVDNGRKALNRLLQERHIHVTQAELDEALVRLLPVYKLQNTNDLLVEIGFGSISPQAALARMNPDWAGKARKPPTRTKADRRRSTGPIEIEGLEGVEMRLANCCSPIPGDPIVAFVTRGRGVTVHHEDCANLDRIRRDGGEIARLMPARWRMGEQATHTVVLRVEAEDKSGLLNSLTSILSRHNIFINSCHTRSDHKKGTATLQFEVNVRDVQQVEDVLAAMRAENAVLSATRRKRANGAPA